MCIMCSWTLPTEPYHDWHQLMARKAKALEDLSASYRQKVEEQENLTFIECKAHVTGPHSVAAGDTTYTVSGLTTQVNSMQD